MRRGAVRFARAAAALIAVAPMTARADTKAACTSAYEQGQILRRRGELKNARSELLVCARSPCPDVLRGDCAEWLAALEKSLSSIVVVARASDGTDLADARVAVDGQVVAESLDGRAIELDPGPHMLRIERRDGAFVERRVVLAEGEKSREIAFALPPRSALPSPGRLAPPPADLAVGAPATARGARPSDDLAWGSIAAAGVGVVALGGFAAFGVLGRNEQVHHLDPCRPTCPPDDIQSVRTKYLVADVSLTVGIVALGVATVLWLTHGGAHARE